MAKETILWTTSPKGVAGGNRLTASILVSPRLTGGTKLGQFPDLRHWNEVTPTFTVQFQGGPQAAAEVVPVVPRDPSLWDKLFSDNTDVIPFKFDESKLGNQWIRSYSVRNIVAYLKNQYAQVAVASPTEFPAQSTLQQGFDPLGGLNNRGTLPKLNKQLNGLISEHNAKLPGAQPDPKLDFFELKRFYQRGQKASVNGKKPKMDFHRLLSMLGEHPFLMRKLGLLFDIEFDNPGVTGLQKVKTTVAWDWVLPDQDVKNESPWTRCEILTDRFVVAPRPVDPLVEDGFLKLDPNNDIVVQVDVDGAALRAMQFADNLRHALSNPSEETPEQFALPALRSGGLALARDASAYKLVQHFAAAKVVNGQIGTPPGVVLSAEDMLRGWRIDIFDEDKGEWLSLCKRKSSYAFDKGPSFDDPDGEGWVSTAVTAAADGSSPDLYLQEQMFSWKGWSLVAGRPGQIVDPAGGIAADEAGTDKTFGLSIDHEATPMSLPRLRFGHGYRIRARFVDVAGNSVGLESLDDTFATDTAPYVRFEPVQSPAILLTDIPGSGESTERLVIRDVKPSTPQTDRHIAPPKAAVEMCEQLGVFDTATGFDTDTFSILVAREGKSYATMGQEIEGTNNRYYPEAQVGVPYLPDPMARGVTFRGLPGQGVGVLQVPVYFEAWPSAQSFRIALKEGNGAPIPPTQANPILTVQLPKAEIATALMSSYMDIEDAALMGIIEWVEETMGALAAQQLKTQAQRGVVWLVTPYRELMLVHAVRQPLFEPAWKTPSASKVLGNTFAHISDLMRLSRKSTEKTDVIATWTDPIDDITKDNWEEITFTDQAAFSFEVEERDGPDELEFRGQHEFKDTKYHAVDYTAIATTRYAEYFVQAKEESLGSSILDAEGVVPGSEKVMNLGGDKTFVKDKDYEIDYKTGEIKSKAGGSLPAGPVKITYIANPITTTSTPTTLDILNSARPSAPKILYVVPIFKWETRGVGTGVTRERTGNALRVYIDRPWWSSGAGEKLGVVMFDHGQGRVGVPDVPDEAKPYVTRWGLDPLWVSDPTDPYPAIPAFGRADATSREGLSVGELANLKNGTPFRVVVAAHGVEFDPIRKLWFSDIEVDSGLSYTPFIRLALARFQPKSVDDAHLSRISLAQFMQLTPDRSVSVIPSGNRTFRVSLSGVGHSDSDWGEPNEVVVSVETPLVGVDDPVLGWEEVQGSDTTLDIGNSRADQVSIWSGTIQLPPDGDRFRLVFREFELIRSDLPTNVPLPARRIVFADALEVDANATLPPEPQPTPTPTRTPDPRQTPEPEPTEDPTPEPRSSPSRGG